MSAPRRWLGWQAATVAAMALLLGVPVATATPPSPWQQTVPPFVTMNGVFARPGLVTAPATANAKRMAELEVIASYAASNYKRLGFTAPKLKVMEPGLLGRLAGSSEPSAYVLAYSRNGLASAAAAYAGGVVVDAAGRMGRLQEISGGAVTTLVNSQLAAVTGQFEQWDGHIFLGEVSMFETADLKTYPERAKASVAHELFHAIQASYPAPRGDDTGALSAALEDGRRYAGEGGKWMGEGLPDAIALHAIKGLEGFDFKRRYASGHCEFSKGMGLRPWDYPLELSSFPSFALNYQKCTKLLNDVKDRYVLAGYQTSAFWRYVFEHSMPRGREWRALPAAMRKIGGYTGGSRNHNLLRWTDDTIKSGHPAFTRGLYDAFPAFIADLVEAPDQFYKSRKGLLKHPEWLENLFAEGCPRVEIPTGAPMVKLTMSLRPRAAGCVRIAWAGDSYGDTGWPAATITAMTKDGRFGPLNDLHLGLRGKREGDGHISTDAKTQKHIKVWSGRTLDPLNPSKTNREAVLTFINIGKEANPSATVAQEYEIRLGFAMASATGNVTKPGDEKRPASTGRANTPRKALPALSKPGSPDDTPELQPLVGPFPLDDADGVACTNQALKLAGTAPGLTIARETENPPTADLTGGACQRLMVKAQAAMLRGEAGTLSNRLGINLTLPAVPSGTVGAVKGATAQVEWMDPAQRAAGFDVSVTAETDEVQVTISEANPAYVMGSFTARFNREQHDAIGSVSGEFLHWRSDGSSKFPEDPLDLMSSDFLLAASYAGMDVQQMSKQAREANAESSAPPPPSSSGGGRGGVLEPSGCNCDCTEMLSKSRREGCAAQCSADFPLMGLSCAMEGERSKGNAPDETNRRIEQCPKTCAEVRRQPPSELCAVAMYLTYSQCGSRDVTAAEIERYLDILVAAFPEPTRSEQRAVLRQQVQAMDAETRNLIVRTTLEASTPPE